MKVLLCLLSLLVLLASSKIRNPLALEINDLYSKGVAREVKEKFWKVDCFRLIWIIINKKIHYLLIYLVIMISKNS